MEPYCAHQLCGVIPAKAGIQYSAASPGLLDRPLSRVCKNLSLILRSAHRSRACPTSAAQSVEIGNSPFRWARLEGWQRVLAVHPSFETPCCARLLRMRSLISSQALSRAMTAVCDFIKIKSALVPSDPGKELTGDGQSAAQT